MLLIPGAQATLYTWNPASHIRAQPLCFTVFPSHQLQNPDSTPKYDIFQVASANPRPKSDREPVEVYGAQYWQTIGGKNGGVGGTGPECDFVGDRPNPDRHHA